MAAPTAVEPEAALPPRPAPQPQALPPPQTKLVEPEGLVSGASIEEAVKPPTAQEIPPPLEVPPPSAPAEPAPQTAQVTAPPSLAQKLKFEYPPLSRRRNEEGTVVLDVEVGKDGTVGAVRIEKSSGFAGLDKAALNAAVKLRFNPAKRGAEPVEGHVHVPFEFRLKDN